jgi:hypothetical protein
VKRNRKAKIKGNKINQGAGLWLGFLVTSSSIEVIWMGRTVKLWLFEAMCSLIITVTMGAIIAGW